MKKIVLSLIGVLCFALVLMTPQTAFSKNKKEKNSNIKVELSTKDNFVTGEDFKLSALNGVEYTDETGNLVDNNSAYLIQFVFITTDTESLKYINSFTNGKQCTFKIKMNNVYFGGTCNVIGSTYLNNVVNIEVLTKTVSSTKVF